MLRNLQALRAFAALSVVFFHFSLVPALKMPWHFGLFGVDLFFVLSGFIIAYSADREPRHFLTHRLIRVLPPYWIVTTLGALMAASVMKFADVAYWYGQSLMFLDGPHGRPPIIPVGWTLVYELGFYLIYAIALRGGRVLAPLAAIVLLGALAYGPARLGAPLRPWPLLVEFVYGIAIFLVTKRVKGVGPAFRWSCAALACAGLALLYLFNDDVRALNGLAQDARRIIVLGLPAAAVVLGLVLIEKTGWSLRNRIVLALGAASYAMYLLHPLVFAAVLGLKPGALTQRVEIFGILTGVTLVLSLIFYWLVEAPLIRLLRRWFGHDAPPVVQQKA